MTTKALSYALLALAVVLILVALLSGGNTMWIALGGVAVALAAVFLNVRDRGPRKD